MTDRERDQIDADAELYIKTCLAAIQQLRTQGLPTIITTTTNPIPIPSGTTAVRYYHLCIDADTKLCIKTCLAAIQQLRTQGRPTTTVPSVGTVACC